MRRWVVDYATMIVGGAAFGVGVVSLIVPAHLADGGVTGLAIVTHYVTGLRVGLLYFALNIPLLIWAWIAQGFRFLWRTLVGVALCSAFTTALAGAQLNVGDRLLAAVYGGLCIGVGIGLTLRAGGSTGGTDIVARYLNRRYGWAFSQTYLLSDVVVLSAVAIWVGLPAAMYAWICTNVAGRVVGYVVEGPRQGRVALVITDRADAVLRRVTGELDRGATRLRATGAWTGHDRPLLLIAAAQHDVPRLRQIVLEEDARAFVIVLPAAEVLGEGFFGLRAAAGGDD